MEMFREVCMTGTRAVGFAKQPRHLLCIICKQHVVAPSSLSPHLLGLEHCRSGHASQHIYHPL
jgi:hypothetical protein